MTSSKTEKRYGGKKGRTYPHLQRAAIRNCLLCGDEFRAVKDFKERKQKYCSKKCWSVRATIINRCLQCGNRIKTYKSVDRKYCGLECRNKGMTGRRLPEEHSRKISEALRGKLPKNHWRSGEQHPFWRKDRENMELLDTPEYRKIRLGVLKRDDYTCQECGIRGKCGVRPKLQVDHIKSRMLYPELAMEQSNLRTLCLDCHRQTPSFLNRWQLNST